MKQNFVRHKLKRGEASLGTWLTLPDTVAARLMARTGFDWLTVELEHTPVNFETAANSFAIISASGKVPLARVPINSVENIKRVLDTGAFGIVVPMVKSREEAEAAVARPWRSPRAFTATYYAKANEEILVVVMAEHVKAIEEADEILSVPGIDVVFIGPNDLHNSMGKPPTFDSEHKEYVDALKHILKTAKTYGIAPGIHVADAAAGQRRLADGFQFIAVASEAGFMLSKAQEVTSALGVKSSGTVAKY